MHHGVIVCRALNGKAFSPARTAEDVKALGFTIMLSGAGVPFTPEQVNLVLEALEQYREDPISALHGYTDVYKWLSQKVLSSERSARDVRTLLERLARSQPQSSGKHSATEGDSDSDSVDSLDIEAEDTDGDDIDGSDE